MAIRMVMISTKMTMMPAALIDNEEKMAILMTGLIIITIIILFTLFGDLIGLEHHYFRVIEV